MAVGKPALEELRQRLDGSATVVAVIGPIDGLATGFVLRYDDGRLVRVKASAIMGEPVIEINVEPA